MSVGVYLADAMRSQLLSSYCMSCSAESTDLM